jgi:hypothetical protein
MSDKHILLNYKLVHALPLIIVKKTGTERADFTSTTDIGTQL